uniref:B box-type domain-containing protein n=1 Tax=Ananas comosus var. bracteatus TaxID=296719 RepID=A0A6V7NSE4_ANACO|nr:unnamed protein product [Ananas comosus var. bracteatus]
MRTICDVCESAAAVLFCAADEAALCRPCDEKVHMCNKLASRHVRVGLADPNEVPRCDICENAPAFFYCEIDGTSLCLQCDMIVHVGGKRTHGRYLLLRQRVEFPGDKAGRIEDQSMQPKDQIENRREHNQVPSTIIRESMMNHKMSTDPGLDGSSNDHARNDSKMIDLNMRPARAHGQTSNTQTQGAECSNNHDSPVLYHWFGI